MNKFSVTLLGIHTSIIFLFILYTTFLGRSGNYVDFFVPIPLMDYPVTVVMEWIAKTFSIAYFLNNRAVVLLSFLVLGGLQWFAIGFVLSKVGGMIFGDK